MKLKQYLKNFHNFLINQSPTISKLSVLTTFIIGLYFNYHRVREDSIIILPTLNGEWITIRLPSLEKIAYVPAPADADHGTAKHLNRIKQIYQNDEIQVSEDDIVFDIGAYVGTFTIFAAETARTVFAIDPSASRNDCLYKNTESYDNIEIIPKPVWSRQKKVELKLSFAPNDNSIINIDEPENDLNRKVSIEATTICDIAEENDIDTIDFLKIEAEGAEPEVLEGAMKCDTTIENVVINCAPERHGKSSTRQVTDILDREGFHYQIETTSIWNADIVYASPNNV